MNVDHKSESLMRTLFKTIPTHVYYKDLDLRYVIASDIYQQYIKNLTGKNLIGKKDADLYEDQYLVNCFYEDDIKIINTKKGIHYISKLSMMII